MSLADVLKWGSNFEMSPPWATINSRFWVVCAPAGPASAEGRAAAAPATPAAFNSSRRVRPLIETPPGRVLLFAGTRVRLSRARGGVLHFAASCARPTSWSSAGGGDGAGTSTHLQQLRA